MGYKYNEIVYKVCIHQLSHLILSIANKLKLKMVTMTIFIYNIIKTA